MAKKRPEQLEINDLETLKILTDPSRLAILETLHEPSTVTEIAERLDVPRTRLYHHIKLLEERGLIRVGSTRKKGAMEEKVYEPAADSFAPGPKLMESGDPAERVEAAVAGILDTTREDLRRSLLRHWSEDRSAEPKEIGLNRGLVRLTPAEAEQFIEEYEELTSRYASLHTDDESGDDSKLFAHTWVFYPSSRDRV